MPTAYYNPCTYQSNAFGACMSPETVGLECDAATNQAGFLKTDDSDGVLKRSQKEAVANLGPQVN